MRNTSNQELVRTLEDAGAGRLEVHTAYIDGVEVSKAFTLASLADVLGVPLPTIEGRYARARLKLWKVDIPSRAGRPMRGFPYAKLQDVLTIMRTPRAVVQHDPNAAAIIPMRGNDAYPLVVTQHEGQDYYTVTALSEHFNMSPTTIRKKLAKAGLMGKAVNLGSTINGGRPARGFPAALRGQLKLAIDEGVPFRTPVDRMLVSNGALESAKSEMDHASVVRPPAPLERSTAQPSARGNVVPLHRRPDDARDLQIDALMTQINSIMSKSTPVVMEPPRLPDTNDYRITAAEYRETLETWRQRYLSDTSALPATEDMSTDISRINAHAEQAGLTDLVLTPAQVQDTVEQWSAEWRRARADREPEIVAVREMLWDAMTKRDDKPTVEELWAASTVFSFTKPLTSEIKMFREQLASHHQMLKMVRASVPAEVRVTQAYAAAESTLTAMLDAKQAELAAQRRAADRLFDRLIAAEPMDEMALAAMVDQMVDEGIHPAYAQSTIEKVRWYFAAANGSKEAA